MTATAVVTGSAARVDDVARAMERRGVKVLRFDRNSDLAEAGAALATGSLDYYLQLPGDVPSPRGSNASALAALFGEGMVRRFREVDVLLPRLAPGCAVVLVTGETIDELPPLEYPHAPTCLLEMLAAAIVADQSPTAVRTTVVNHHRSADQIADIALANGPNRGQIMAGYANRAPEMNYDEWRLACLSTTGPEG